MKNVESDSARLARGLLDWFAGAARDLPWRRNRSPWSVWVSEVMLQQTTAATAAAAFERFMTRFPTLEDMARAEEADVVSAWAGLGYYRRARFLHRGARAASLAGGIPRTAEALRKIPGVGPYTAGAVASLAFGERVPAIDGNVARVMSRFEAVDASPESARGRATLEAAALRLMPAENAGAFNEALIELGATICTPTRPRCEECPLRAGCLAADRGETALYPRPKSRPEPVAVRSVRVVVRRDGEVLLCRRPADAALLSGQEELPGRWLFGEEDPADALIDVLEELGARSVRIGALLGAAKHTVTKHRIRCEAYEGVADFEDEPRAGVRFASVEELLGPGVTTETRKLRGAAVLSHMEATS